MNRATAYKPEPAAVRARSETKTMAYSVAFKASMVRKMTGRGAVTATALEDETGGWQGDVVAVEARGEWRALRGC